VYILAGLRFLSVHRVRLYIYQRTTVAFFFFLLFLVESPVYLRTFLAGSNRDTRGWGLGVGGTGSKGWHGGCITKGKESNRAKGARLEGEE